MSGVKKEIFTVGAEIDGYTSSGKVKAIACTVVMDDGSLKTWVQYLEGEKFPLTAATALLHDQMIENCKLLMEIKRENK